MSDQEAAIRGESGLLVEDEMFVHEWISRGYGDGGPAYKKIHPKVSKETAGKKASELLKSPLIKAYVCGIVKDHLDKYEVTEDNIISELAGIAFLDIAEFVAEDGSVLGNINDIDKKARRAISSISEGINGRITIKACSKEKALELLAKYKKLLTEMHVVSTDKDLSAEITAGRKRAGIQVTVSMEDILN